MAEECHTHVCPLTSALFDQWLDGKAKDGAHSADLYVRVLDHLAPEVPAWPRGSTREEADEVISEEITQALENWLRESGGCPALANALEYLRKRPKLASLDSELLLTALRRALRMIVDFPEPDRPRLRLRRLRLLDFSLPVLAESSEPLTPEEIMERARKRFGADTITLSARGAENALSADPRIARLGPRSFGLRKHFASREKDWPIMRNSFAVLLTSENRPISTIEVLEQQSIKLPAEVNSYELAEIVRDDPRFLDLGRRLFALAEWGVQEREQIKDLLPRVLAQADRPLNIAEIYERLTRFRSATFPGLANVLQKQPEIRILGFGYSGACHPHILARSCSAELVGEFDLAALRVVGPRL